MSEQSTHETTEEEYDEAARRGQAIALLMLDAVDGKFGANNVMVMLNAIGNIVESVFANMPMCDLHTLEEYDNWCAYTRTRIVAEQQGEGETRQ